MAEEKEQTKGRKRRIAIGAVTAVLLLLAGSGILRHALQTATPQSSVPAPTVGTVDMEKVLAAHPLYDKLTRLRAERDALALRAREKKEAWTVQPPALESTPFEDAAEQKDAQTLIEERTSIERERSALAEAYRKEHGEEFRARSEALDKEYLNRILNLNLQLDNQSAMHHPWDKAEELEKEREGWEAELEALKQERGERQAELHAAWEKEIKDHVNAAIAPKLAAWQQRLATASEQAKAQALAKQSAVDARNVEAMERAMAAVDANAQKNVQELLWKKEQEVQALESRIANDMSGRAAKLAILHHLTLILASPMEGIATKLPLLEGAQGVLSPERFQTVIPVDAMDLTEELVEEMKTLPSEEAAGDNAQQ